MSHLAPAIVDIFVQGADTPFFQRSKLRSCQFVTIAYQVAAIDVSV
jgi:hypothetical protein